MTAVRLVESVRPMVLMKDVTVLMMAHQKAVHSADLTVDWKDGLDGQTAGQLDYIVQTHQLHPPLQSNCLSLVFEDEIIAMLRSVKFAQVYRFPTKIQTPI